MNYSYQFILLNQLVKCLSYFSFAYFAGTHSFMLFVFSLNIKVLECYQNDRIKFAVFFPLSNLSMTHVTHDTDADHVESFLSLIQISLTEFIKL